MNKRFLSACIAAIICLNACSEQAEYDSSLTIPATSSSSVSSVDTLKSMLPETAQAPITISKQVTPSIAAPSSSSKNIAALNPKHGAPGHRCDIAVGAPLNSTVQPEPQATPVIQISPAKPKALINSGGTFKLNPAHGQPGHDCKIPVGEPLKG